LIDENITDESILVNQNDAQENSMKVDYLLNLGTCYIVKEEKETGGLMKHCFFNCHAPWGCLRYEAARRAKHV